jgi:hypothetical protein
VNGSVNVPKFLIRSRVYQVGSSHQDVR